MRGFVRAIDGPVRPEELGVTSIHEHILLDLRTWSVPPRTAAQEEFAERPLEMEMLGLARRDPLVYRDVLVLDDIELMSAEVAGFRAAGGVTIVEVTVDGLGPNPDGLREVSARSGVRIVAGVGYYPAQHANRGGSTLSLLDEYSNILLRNVRDGIGSTGVRPGVLGAFGTHEPVTDAEWIILGAACEVQQETGLPLFVDAYWGPRRGSAPEVVEFILRNGVHPSRVNIGHMDSTLELDYVVDVLEKGVYISLDTFGFEVYYDSVRGTQDLPHDTDRERLLVELLRRGYADRILLGQDVCTKLQLQRFGGYGYGHLLRHIIPSLEHKGVDRTDIEKMLIVNPRTVLTI